MTDSRLAPSTIHRTDLRTVAVLVAVYLAVSVATLIAIAVMRDNPAIVNTAAWIRGGFAVGNGIVLTLLAIRARAGAPRAFFRLRLVSAIILVAIAVIVAIPGTFPLWMKIEQGVCGALLVVVVILVNSRRLRGHFAEI
jgi:hypothetical protein